MNHLRISYTEKNGEIKGVTQACNDGLFLIEALAISIRHIAAAQNVTPNMLLRHIDYVISKEVDSNDSDS